MFQISLQDRATLLLQKLSFPRATIKKAKKENSRQGKSRVFTDTPEKNRLEEMEHARERRKQTQYEGNQKRLLKQVFSR